MPLLLTNDDGLGADGLLALEKAASGFGPIRVIAPKEALSGCGHRVTTHAPIWWEPGPYDHHHALVGTPADCVRIALHEWGRDWDWVLSGINAGGNLGADVPISGTIAAAREAAYHGIRAASFSHYKKRELDFDWDRAASWVVRVMGWLDQNETPPGSFWNVNFPHLGKNESEPEIIRATVGRHPLPLDFRKGEKGWIYSGNYHERGRDPGSDVAICFEGNIAVTLLSV
jgi:5'-nucleotidase